MEVTVDLPVSGCIVQATPATLYLGLTLDLHLPRIADLLLRSAPTPSRQPSSAAALAVSALA